MVKVERCRGIAIGAAGQTKIGTPGALQKRSV